MPSELPRESLGKGKPSWFGATGAQVEGREGGSTANARCPASFPASLLLALRFLLTLFLHHISNPVLFLVLQT